MKPAHQSRGPCACPPCEGKTSFRFSVELDRVRDSSDSRLGLCVRAANPNGISVPTTNNDDENSTIGGVHPLHYFTDPDIRPTIVPAAAY
eukprot:scaffold9383_cov110-Skeletonema_marinoi.AAC.3